MSHFFRVTWNVLFSVKCERTFIFRDTWSSHSPLPCTNSTITEIKTTHITRQVSTLFTQNLHRSVLLHIWIIQPWLAIDNGCSLKLSETKIHCKFFHIYFQNQSYVAVHYIYSEMKLLQLKPSTIWTKLKTRHSILFNTIDLQGLK